MERTIRRVIASGLIAVAVLAAFVAGVAGYVNGHFHDPDEFVVNTQSLDSDAEIRERLFDGFRDEIVSLATGTAVDVDELADGEQADEEADEVDGAGDPDAPVTDEAIERDQAIEQVLIDVFDSDLFGEMFEEQLGSVQAQIVRSAALPESALLRDSGEVNFDARRLYPSIYAALAADPLTAEITQNEVPDSFGVYKVADRDTTANGVWWMIENARNWRGLGLFLAIVGFVAAVVIAERRPSRVIQFGFGVLGLAVVAIVLVYLVRAVVPLLAGGGSSGAVAAAYTANLAPFVSAMIRLVVLGGVLVVIGGIAKLIWPDDWVYGHVTDDRGSRSVRSWRGAPESQPQADVVPQALPGGGVPVGYPAPYGYAPGWAPPYPGQGYPQQPYGQPGYPQQGYAQHPYGQPEYAQPGYPPQYPAGPVAQPAAVADEATGNPTVPVMPVSSDGEEPLADGPAASGSANLSDLPSDAAQLVPQVVASAPEPSTPEPSTSERSTPEPSTPEPSIPQPIPEVVVPEMPAAGAAVVEPTQPAGDDDDGWASEEDW